MMRSLLEDPKSCVGHPNRPGKICQPVSAGSQVPLFTPVLVGSAAANRSEMVSPAVYAAQSASRTDRDCSATWPGRGGGSALPASSRGLAVRAPQAAQYSRARGHVVGVVIEMSGCDACLDRRVVVILEPCVRPLFAGSCQGLSVGGCGVCSRA